jgi:cell wall-associated NlpC family hydrolase
MPYADTRTRAIQAYIDRNGGGPLTAEAIVRGSQGTGVDPRALAIIAQKESQFGRTSGRFKNNAYGWGVHLSPSVNTSPDWATGTRKVAQGLSGPLYKGAGLKSLRDIIMKYAPPSENNTELYIKQSEDRYRSMGGDPSNIFGGGGKDAVPTTGPASTPQQASSETMADSIAAGLMNRQPNERLIQTVTRSALQALAANPQNTPQRAKIAANAVASAAGALGGKAAPVQAAKQFLGTPYSWGGGSPSGPTRGFGRGASTVGFDCSSLVQYAWAKAGVKLPRTTYDQIKFGRAVPNIQSAAPGDLLFPHTGHVQMYIGNGKVIEAPRTGGHVQIVPARSRYVAIRRPA